MKRERRDSNPRPPAWIVQLSFGPRVSHEMLSFKQTNASATLCSPPRARALPIEAWRGKCGKRGLRGPTIPQAEGTSRKRVNARGRTCSPSPLLDETLRDWSDAMAEADHHDEPVAVHGAARAAMSVRCWFGGRSRPLLTIEVWQGNHGQARVTAATKIPQTEGIPRNGMTARRRLCPRLCSLSVPSASAFASRARPLRRRLGACWF